MDSLLQAPREVRTRDSEAAYDLGWGGKRGDDDCGNDADTGGASGGARGVDGSGEGHSNHGDDDVTVGGDVTVEGEERDSVSPGRGFNGIMTRVRVDEIAAGALYSFCLSYLLIS